MLCTKDVFFVPVVYIWFKPPFEQATRDALSCWTNKVKHQKHELIGRGKNQLHEVGHDNQPELR
jgi:hypothetical protein